MLVRFSACAVGKVNFRDYLILGDDVVIAGREVAEAYRKIMEGIGVKISETKSLVPGTRLGCEFASKLVLGEHDLSPFPVGLIVKGDLIARARLTEVVAKRFHAAHLTRLRV